MKINVLFDDRMNIIDTYTIMSTNMIDYPYW